MARGRSEKSHDSGTPTFFDVNPVARELFRFDLVEDDRVAREGLRQINGAVFAHFNCRHGLFGRRVRYFYIAFAQALEIDVARIRICQSRIQTSAVGGPAKRFVFNPKPFFIFQPLAEEIVAVAYNGLFNFNVAILPERRVYRQGYVGGLVVIKVEFEVVRRRIEGLGRCFSAVVSKSFAFL